MTRPIRALSLLALALCYFVAFVAAQQPQFTGRVVAVIDGDTLGILRAGREVRVRLDGVDAPENGQDFSQRSKQFTSAAAFGKDVRVIGKDVDRYGRLVARVLLDDFDLSVEIVRAGLAWHYVEYSKDPVLRDAEISARQRRLGLWTQGNAMPPWEFRNGPSASTPKPLAALPLVGVQQGKPVFLGNTRSQVVHAHNCPSLKTCKYCTDKFESVAKAVAAGYRPHSGRGGCILD